jgi:hypothetical protein
MSDYDPLERTLDVFVYGPIGAGRYFLDEAPSFFQSLVSRGRAEVGRRQEEVQQRVTTARSMGQVVLAFGMPMLREKLQRGIGDARTRAEAFVDTTRRGSSRRQEPPLRVTSVSGPIPATEPTSAPRAAPMPSRVAAPDTAGAPASDELPIPGYDALSASQVVERLVGLAPSELDAVHAYENAHRQRRTILGKIEQLAG